MYSSITNNREVARVAVDFDNTITTRSKFPETGKLNPKALEFLYKLKELGCYIILNTARTGPAKEEAINLCFKWGLPINEVAWGSSKVEAHYYVDDRCHKLYTIDFDKEYENIKEIYDLQLWKEV